MAIQEPFFKKERFRNHRKNGEILSTIYEDLREQSRHCGRDYGRTRRDICLAQERALVRQLQRLHAIETQNNSPSFEKCFTLRSYYCHCYSHCSYASLGSEKLTATNSKVEAMLFERQIFAAPLLVLDVTPTATGSILQCLWRTLQLVIPHNVARGWHVRAEKSRDQAIRQWGSEDLVTSLKGGNLRPE